MNKNSKEVSMKYFEKKVPEKYSKYNDTTIKSGLSDEVYFSNGGRYHSWTKYNDELVNKQQFYWSGYFELTDSIKYESSYRGGRAKKQNKLLEEPGRPYLEPGPTGYMRPTFMFTITDVFPDDYELLLSRLNLEIGKEVPVEQIPLVTSYRDSLLDQMTRQAVEINRINEEFASVLKVCCFETEEEARIKIKNAETKTEKEALSKSYSKSISDIKEIFSLIKTGIRMDDIQDTNIHGYINSNPFIDDYLKATTHFGIQHLSEKKDPMLNIAERFATEIYVLESIIENILLNEIVPPLEGEQDDERSKYWYDPKNGVYNYWETAYEIRRKYNYSWPQTYDHICLEMERLGLPLRHSSVGSFKTMRKRFEREHGYPS